MVFRVDLNIKDNIDWAHGFSRLSKTDNAPIPFTGTLLMQVKRRAADEHAVFELSSANGFAAIDSESTHQFTLRVPAGSIPVGQYVYDLLNIRVDGEIELVMGGSLAVSRGVTHAPE
jgi:hypothetical protein